MWAIGGLCLVVEILRLGFQLPYPAETSLKPGLNSDNNTILRRVECTANLVLPVTSRSRGVPQAIIEFLFESGLAAPETGAFLGR